MQLWRFLAPSALGFTLKNMAHGIFDTVTGKPPRPTMAATYVSQHATQGDAASVLHTLDECARTQRWLMSVGPEKGPLVQEMAGRLPANPRVLELGAYCGYSAILLASTFGEGARIVSIEVGDAAIEASRANAEMAGVSRQVEFIHGPSTKMIEALEGSFDLVFLDHWKDLYKPDLQLLEARGLVRSGTIVVADNVGEIFGATGYLEYVRQCGRYSNEHRKATIEYTAVKDAVEISTYN